MVVIGWSVWSGATVFNTLSVFPYDTVLVILCFDDVKIIFNAIFASMLGYISFWLIIVLVGELKKLSIPTLSKHHCLFMCYRVKIYQENIYHINDNYMLNCIIYVHPYSNHGNTIYNIYDLQQIYQNSAVISTDTVCMIQIISVQYGL